MKIKKIIASIILLGTLLSLTSCSLYSKAQSIIDRAENRIEEFEKEFDKTEKPDMNKDPNYKLYFLEGPNRLTFSVGTDLTEDMILSNYNVLDDRNIAFGITSSQVIAFNQIDTSRPNGYTVTLKFELENGVIKTFPIMIVIE